MYLLPLYFGLHGHPKYSAKINPRLYHGFKQISGFIHVRSQFCFSSRTEYNQQRRRLRFMQDAY